MKIYKHLAICLKVAVSYISALEMPSLVNEKNSQTFHLTLNKGQLTYRIESFLTALHTVSPREADDTYGIAIKEAHITLPWTGVDLSST